MREYKAGTGIVRHGQPGNQMYFLSKGMVNVILPDGRVFPLYEGKRNRLVVFIVHASASVKASSLGRSLAS